MNTFIALGLLCFLASDLYNGPRSLWHRLHRTPRQIYQGYRTGELRPAWSRGLFVLGFGLLLLGLWREWVQ